MKIFSYHSYKSCGVKTTAKDLAKKAFKKGKSDRCSSATDPASHRGWSSKGKKATCYVSVCTDLKNADGIYLNKSVVVDENLVTSCFPADLPNFCRKP